MCYFYSLMHAKGYQATGYEERRRRFGEEEESENDFDLLIAFTSHLTINISTYRLT